MHFSMSRVGTYDAFYRISLNEQSAREEVAGYHTQRPKSVFLSPNKLKTARNYISDFIAQTAENHDISDSADYWSWQITYTDDHQHLSYVISPEQTANHDNLTTLRRRLSDLIN